MTPTTPRKRTGRRWFDYAPGVPRWARAAAHLIAVCTLPAMVWRLGIVVEFPVGYDQAWIHRSRLDTAFGDVRMVLLSVLSELLALLAFGLVQRWGEVVPPWLIAFRGRRIPTWPPALLAVIGGIGLTVVWTGGVVYAAVTGTPFDAGTTPGPPTTVQLIAYAPMVVWGPLLLALAVHYRRRRIRRHGAAAPEDR